jgi:hypothetical protein
MRRKEAPRTLAPWHPDHEGVPRVCACVCTPKREISCFFTAHSVSVSLVPADAADEDVCERNAQQGRPDGARRAAVRAQAPEQERASCRVHGPAESGGCARCSARCCCWANVQRGAQGWQRCLWSVCLPSVARGARAPRAPRQETSAACWSAHVAPVRGCHWVACLACLSAWPAASLPSCLRRPRSRSAPAVSRSPYCAVSWVPPDAEGPGHKGKERAAFSFSRWLLAPSSRAIRIRICYFCALFYLFAGVGFVAVNSPADEGRWVWVDDELPEPERKAADARALNESKAMMSRFEEDGTLPTFGLTAGRTSNANGTKCNKKLARWCDGYCSMHGSQPPDPLLAAGRLAERHDLDHTSQCFIWYTNGFYSRALGGRGGRMLPRMGPGVDNKGYFVRALREYEDLHGCQPYQVCT